MERETSFGAALRERRRALDLTQWDLGERIGCSGGAIQKIEAGERRPSKQVAELLAACLGVAPEERPAFVRWARSGRDAGPLPPTPTGAPPADPPAPSAPPAITSGSPLSRAAGISALPAPLTPLLGRAPDLAQVRGYLARDEVRLVTLTGAPGIGKTRLALAVAAAASEFFVDGVHFVSLAATNAPDLVLATIAQALGVAAVTGPDVLAAVALRLRKQQVLVLLDNFEQVLDAAPQIMELLAACPRLKVLITSREALHAYGEWQFPVPPLQLPAAPPVPDPQAVAGVPSVALFLARAQAVAPRFTLSEENAGVVAELCRRLDGLPLAIELAAARVKLLPPRAILDRLSSGLALLRASVPYLPARQQTLSKAIEWSYGLLQEPQQRLFRRLGVFARGFTLEACEAVCNPGGSLGIETFEGIAALVEASLVSRAEERGDEPRFSLLQTIRDYAAERLAADGEEEAIRRRHALYYCHLAQQAEPALITGPQEVWVGRLGEEHDNLRAALAWCMGQDDSEPTIASLSMGGSLWRFWLMHGHLSEGRRWLARALEAADRSPAGGGCDLRLKAAKARALRGLGSLAYSQGDYAAAQPAFEAAMAINRELNDERETGGLLNGLANLLADMGRMDEARRALEESLAIARRRGYADLVTQVWGNLGRVEADLGDYQRARVYSAEAVGQARAAGNMTGLMYGLLDLGIDSVQLGEHDRARLELAEALQISRDLGADLNCACVLDTLAEVSCDEQDYAEARARHLQALAIRLKLGQRSGVAECLRGLADAAVASGSAERAARIYGAAEALREEVGASPAHASRQRYERFTAAGRGRLGDAAWERATREGRLLSLEQAVALAGE